MTSNSPLVAVHPEFSPQRPLGHPPLNAQLAQKAHIEASRLDRRLVLELLLNLEGRELRKILSTLPQVSATVPEDCAGLLTSMRLSD